MCDGPGNGSSRWMQIVGARVYLRLAIVLLAVRLQSQLAGLFGQEDGGA